ncbi:two-component system chemotaxis response regulator CheB [Rheinheimera pacifica]|uniref:protein-glutamate methylesterase/protein-glutamine glutaminase n=1 Tax=Rheinheimera pacifica TaxID=173990 RepID=UPI0021691C27|nr:chemotaxis response regulator protein-glutamate methylesterase [Rheinheimera pacifica]MCS4307229.1 two-component system chemotaxis response regulator CheB [Rheinheimera pacifica]
MKKINVLIVDDSAVVRQVLSAKLAENARINVLDVAADPIYALEKMQKHWPDVIVLDVEMPRMDGISFLRKIMAERPTPVVICSTLTEKGAETSLQALAAGAVSIVTKPKMGLKKFLEDSGSDIVSAVIGASQARLSRLTTAGAAPVKAKPKHTADAVLTASGSAMTQTTEQLVAMGTSTGGTQALEAVLSQLPRVCPGIVIVQHMPEKFTAAFAQRLNNICEIEVLEATHGMRVIPGRALIAPGGKHMLLKRSGAQYYVEVIAGPLVNRHIPSVDVLFRSVAKTAGKNALGIIMTGMGDDGAAGLLEMRQANAYTIAQDEASCVVFGMPKEAIKRDAVEQVMPLSEIAKAIMKW